MRRGKRGQLHRAEHWPQDAIESSQSSSPLRARSALTERDENIWSTARVAQRENMAPGSLDFYESLAEYYHLIFEDWDRSIERQAGVLNALIAKHTGRTSVNLLDCACGIGTQAIGFARAGHCVVASDSCRAAVARAEREAKQRGLAITFFVSDMTSLDEIARSDFHVVAAFDNALPHLTPDQLTKAARAWAQNLSRMDYSLQVSETTTLSSVNDRRFKDLFSMVRAGNGGLFNRFGTG